MRAVLCRLLLLVGLGAVDAQAQVLRGRVVAAGDARPIPGALVELQDSVGRPVQRALTSPTGTFRFLAGRSGAFRVRAAAIGFSIHPVALVTMTGGDMQLPDFRMEAAIAILPDLVAAGKRRLCGLEILDDPLLVPGAPSEDAADAEPGPVAPNVGDGQADGFAPAQAGPGHGEDEEAVLGAGWVGGEYGELLPGWEEDGVGEGAATASGLGGDAPDLARGVRQEASLAYFPGEGGAHEGECLLHAVLGEALVAHAEKQERRKAEAPRAA